MILDGQLSAPILFVSDFQRVDCVAEAKPMSEGMMRPLLSAVRSAGLLSTDYAVTCIHPRMPVDGKTLNKIPSALLSEDIQKFKHFLSTHAASVVVPLGEYAMNVVTGHEGIQKWHCNVIAAKAEFEGRKCIPLLHPDWLSKQYGDFAYLAFGCQRAKAESAFKEIRVPERKFKLGPSFEEAMEELEKLKLADVLSVDIETGGGLINTVGFADSAVRAVAIKTLPEFYSPEQYWLLWKKIAEVLEGPQPKIMQNFIYEATWFSRYGIWLENTCFDTMWAQKFMHPELDKGLDNVGRLYTPYPYWKDDNDNWANIRDWHRHLDYNCKDTTGTYAAYLNQLAALSERKLDKLFHNYVMRFAPVIQEMCCTGLRLDAQALAGLKDKLSREHENYMRIIDTETQSRLGRSLNPRSPKQLKEGLRALGMKLPVQKGKESTDKKALVKLKRKHPDEPILSALIGLSATNKQLSSYVDFEYDRRTGRVHYTLDGCGTETGRWAGYNSGWGEGFNPQTVPKAVRNCFVADPGKTLIQIDLAQAESRYVAWEAPEPALMQMLLEGRDVHKYVASKIFKKPEEIVNKQERQLGKKSGHSANYSVGPRTFAEACLVEMNLYLTEQEARRIIETYFEVFPGIRKRQENIRKEVYNKRMLRTPVGRERHFYGRMDDGTFREAYAYAPQSTIPDITNHLMLALWDAQDCLDVEFLLQVHDSLLLQAPPERVFEIAEFAKDLDAWHPKIILPGGELQIPVEVEVGERWGKMEVI